MMIFLAANVEGWICLRLNLTYLLCKGWGKSRRRCSSVLSCTVLASVLPKVPHCYQTPRSSCVARLHIMRMMGRDGGGREHRHRCVCKLGGLLLLVEIQNECKQSCFFPILKLLHIKYGLMGKRREVNLCQSLSRAYCCCYGTAVTVYRHTAVT